MCMLFYFRRNVVVGSDNVRVGMFRYLGYVDEETEFYLKDTTTQDHLLEQIKVIEDSYDGSSGKSLRILS